MSQSKQIRVLHLDSSASWRGGQQQLVNLVHGLQALGVESVIGCRPESALSKYCEQHGLAHLPLPLKGSVDLGSVKELQRLFKSRQYDVVHMHTAQVHALAVGAHTLVGQVPLILSRKVDFALRTNALTRWKYNYQGIRKIICVSDKVKEVVGALVPDASRLVTVYDGIDPNRFPTTVDGAAVRARFGLPPGIPLVGNTSAITTQKDYTTFIHTVAQLHSLGVRAHYLIMGEGHELEMVADLSAKLGVAGAVTFAGFLRDVEQVLPALDVFLMTSEEEGLGSSILDAYACRVPVVATEVGGIPEIVRHEETGLLAPAKDAKALAQAVQRALTETESRERWVSNAVALLHQRFTVEKLAEATLAVYREVV